MKIVRGENILNETEKLHRIIWSVLWAWVHPEGTEHCILFHSGKF